MTVAGIAAWVVVAVPLAARAQADYPQDVLERYWECTERNNLGPIRELLWLHHHVAPVDASIFGLPMDDLDDRSLLTIAERLEVRRSRTEAEAALPTSGPTQYPHFLRQAFDYRYRQSGRRPDCSQILETAGLPPDLPEGLGGWAGDLNLTSTDATPRGEVHRAVDHVDPSRVVVTAVSTAAPPASNFVASSTDWGQTWVLGVVGHNAGTDYDCDPASYYQRSTGILYHSKIGCVGGWCLDGALAVMRKSTDNGESWNDCERAGRTSRISTTVRGSSSTTRRVRRATATST